MELLLQVVPPAGRPRDLRIELEPETPARAVVEALAQRFSLLPDRVAGAIVERDGRRLPDAAPAAACGLLDGDRLLLEAGDPDAPTLAAGTPSALPEDGAAVDLVVVGGPLSGTRVALAAGSHVIGRGPGADVALGDGAMSRRHFRVEVGDGAVTVADAGSRNGTYVEGVAVEAPVAVAAGRRLEAGRTAIAFEPRAAARPPRHDGRGGVPFNRPPRIARPLPEGRHELAAPPAAAPPASFPMGAAVVPLVLGGSMFAITGQPYTLALVLMSPAMAAWGHFEGRRKDRRERSQGERRFNSELAELVERVGADREGEAAVLRAAAPSPAELRRRVEQLDRALWERRRGDGDFLALRAGVADRRSAVTADVVRGGDEQLRAAAQERLEASALLRDVPVVIPSQGGIGVVGAAGPAAALARSLVLQAAVLHSPAELTIAAAVASGASPDWEWLKWLPHTRGSGRLAVGEAAARDLLDRLARERDGTHRLLLVDGDLALDRAALARAFDGETTMLWCGRDAGDVPAGCAAIAELGDAALRLTLARSGDVVEQVTPDLVAATDAEAVARGLAPVRDVGSQRQSRRIPERVSLLELLDLPDVTGDALAARWETGGAALAAPLGAGADGPFTVDVGRPDGLRGLVAGMPGAGKSELLQALVGALAAAASPADLTFLLVDYKGGAAFGDCAQLPHTVALVTDLDARLAERARVSLVAELRRRERILAQAGARNLRELRARDRHAAPPSLLIVVDEFAAIARELPGFVETVVDVAQRGRSLGLHLVLATQRPRGAVNDTIRANTNLRIAMRVADAAESRDVIEAPDAAAIPAGLPGRALALVGRHADGSPELSAFQAAYGGGRTRGGVQASVTVADLELGALRGHPQTVLTRVGAGAPNDLQALAAAARVACERLELPRPEAPWLPPLPQLLDLAALPAPAAPATAVIGLLDDPAGQRQAPAAIDLERDGSAIVYGTGGAGKTTLLRTLALSLAQRSSPQELQLYALDFASRGLRGLEALPHCGAVVGGDDDERVTRLLGWLARSLAHRRALLADAGATDLEDLRRRRPDGPAVPRIVLLLDGYGAFAGAYERVRFGDQVQALSSLVAEGRPLGVHVVLTADRRSAVPAALAGVVSARVVLRLADADDYVALGVPRSLAAGAELPAGRGFGADGLELQVAVAGGDPGHPAEALAAAGRELEARHPGARAPAVGVMPARVARTALPPGEPLRPVAGLAYETLQPIAADLTEEHVLVAGPPRSGRSTALATLASNLLAAGGAELHLLAPRRTPLTALAGWASCAEGADACRDALTRLAPLLERDAAAPPVVVVVDDAMELGEAPALETLARRGRQSAVRLLAAVETQAAARAYGGWTRELRTGRNGLLLAPGEGDGELLGARLPRSDGAPPPAGRAQLVDGGVATLVQVACD